MAFQRTQIANITLIRIGVLKTIGNLDTESSTEAKTIRGVFDFEVDALLRDFPWPFARKIVTLGLVGGTATENVNNFWHYSYRYPADCLYARQLVTEVGRNNPNPPPFEIGSDDNGQLVYTDEEDAQLEYTRQVTEATQFDSLFISALSWKIGASICAPLSRVKAVIELANTQYMTELRRAQARALNEHQQDDAAESEFIRARD